MEDNELRRLARRVVSSALGFGVSPIDVERWWAINHKKRGLSTGNLYDITEEANKMLSDLKEFYWDANKETEGE